MNLWRSGEIAQATSGNCSGDFGVDAVVIDSRSVSAGALFVALTGGVRDGHGFVAEAIASGAAGALVSNYVDGVAREKQIVVADTEAALQALGVAARARSGAKFFGITGSVGKTGCKEMLKSALNVCGQTYATHGNLNNHLGVPLTLCNMPLATEFAIIEMGMNHAGEIALLSDIVRPDVAIITTVDSVHLEFFGTVEAIADAKCEIFSGMQKQGVAVLNADNPHFARCKRQAEQQGLDRVLSFGTAPSALCRMLHYKIEDWQSVIDASIAGTEIRYRLGATGKHWALMSVAVLAMVEAVGGDMAKAAAQFEFFSEPKGRGQIRKLAVKGGHLRLLDDCYNASPISVAGAIEKVALLRDNAPEPVRTVVVLGDMLELGEHARELHVGLVPSLINNQMDLVFAAGKFMAEMYNALPETMRGAYALSSGELAPKVASSLRPRDLVLVKGSRGSQMELVVQAIEQNATRAEVGEA